MQFALIGCGEQGLAYASAAAELGLSVAVCADPRAASAKKAAAICGARAAISCTSVVKRKDVDAVLLCAPPTDNADYAIRAAKARKHALLRAPFVRGAHQTLNAARAAGTHVYVAYNTRVAPESAAIGAQLDQRAIGRPGFIRIVRVGAAPRGKIGKTIGGAISMLLPEDLDWLSRRFGARLRLFAQTTRAPGLDHASLTLNFPDGPIVQWVGTCRAHGQAPRAAIEVCGDSGMIQFSSDDRVLESNPIVEKSAGIAGRSSPIAPSLAVRHLQDFATLIKANPAADAYAHEVAGLQLLAAVVQSAASGREVRL